jgi:hypothetical protein
MPILGSSWNVAGSRPHAEGSRPGLECYEEGQEEPEPQLVARSPARLLVRRSSCYPSSVL